MVVLAVALGGAVGAPVRFATDRWVEHRSFPGTESRAWPLGTLVVNVIGAALLGVVVGASRYGGLGEGPTLLLGTGFCGALTTFSTVSVEVVRLAQAERWPAAAGAVAANLGLSLASAAVGLGLAAATLT